MKVKVCDAIMGSGKTSAAINMMNSESSSRFMFITPFLDEVQRVKNACRDRHFQTPEEIDGKKLNGLHILLEGKFNVVNTHALFKKFNVETIGLIKNGGYKLILDEVCDVTEFINISKTDVTMLLESKVLLCNGKKISWNPETNYNGIFNELKALCETNNIIMSSGNLFYWMFPLEIFEAFEEIIVLTYQFESQIQKYYFDLYGVEYEKIGVDKFMNFSPHITIPDYVYDLKDKIHILDDKKLNAIGENKNDLSKSWFIKGSNQNKVGQLKKHITNVFINKFQSPSPQNLWTTFKDSRKSVSSNGYKRGFTSYTLRATNEYKNRTHLAYCLNVFLHPSLKSFFLSQGVAVDEDNYALSYLVQWIWRSAIREGGDIWIYIPSSRMRNLLIGWIDSFKREDLDNVL